MTDKKKPMKRGKKDMKQGSILTQLYENKLLSSKVDEALDTGETYDYIIELCAENGLEISKASLTRYKAKRLESIESGEPLENLMDQRKKTGNIIDIQDRKQQPFGEGPDRNMSTYDATFETVDKVYNDLQVLDDIIQKGANGIKFTDTLDVNVALRAMEIKAKLTNNSMQGLSLVGLRELKLRVTARETAMIEVILQFVPEEQHEEAMRALEESEKAYYANLDLSEEDRKITKALESSGMDI